MANQAAWRRRTKALAVIALVATGVVSGAGIPDGGPAQVAHAAGPVIEVGGACTLAQAIIDVNTGTVSAACPDHDPGANVIRITAAADGAIIPGLQEFAPGAPVDLGAAPPALVGGARTALPPILVPMTIEGDGDPRIGIYALPRIEVATICTPVLVNGVLTVQCNVDATQPRGARLFHVAPTGALTLRDLNIIGGDITGVQGSMFCAPTIFNRGCTAVPGTDVQGGAIYAEGALTLDHVTIADAVARGGDGARDQWLDSQDGEYKDVLARGGTASGGAVYAAGPFSASRVLFRNVRVFGGTEGGAALGGAVAFPPGSTTVATISDTIFDRVAAYGGNGSAGANGADGANGSRGANGRCLSSDWSAADGATGNRGGKGEAGENGGDGGDAIGLISGGGRVSIDHSAVIGAVAQAGTAGIGGIGGVGGDGGNGGSGIGCAINGRYIALSSWSGEGGAGGLAGDNGRIGSPGSRGTAVATFDIPGRLDLVNVTIAGAVTTVPEDVYPTGMTQLQWNAARDRADSTVGVHGVGGPGPAGTGATPVSNGTPDTTITARERASGVGLAAAFGSSPTMRAAVSYSTIVDTVATIPSGTGRRASTTPRALSLATGAVALPGRVAGLRGNLIWGSQALACPNLGTNGKNVDDRTCVPVGVDNSDRVSNGRPVDVQVSSIGAVVRPGISIDEPGVRMPVLGLPFGSVARDLGNNDPASVCTLVDGFVTGDDARRGPRDTRCDSGAYEFSPSVGLLVWAPQKVQLGTAGTALVQLDANPGPSSLLVKVEGLFDEVTFPTGFTPTVNNGLAGYSEAELLLTGAEDYPLVITLPLVAAVGSASSVTVVADLTGAAGGPLTASATAPIVDETLLRISAVAPPKWTPCSGWLPITYTANVDGPTSVPAADVRLLPKLVEQDPFSSLLPRTLVEPGPGTTASIVNGDVIWHIPATGPGDGTRSITIYVAVGNVSRNAQPVVYPIGSTIQLGAYVSFPSQPSRPVAADAYPTVYVGDDVDRLIPGASDTFGAFPIGSSGWGTIGGKQSDVYLTGQLRSCDLPSRDISQFTVSASMNVRDLAQPGAPSILPGGNPVEIDATLLDRATGWGFLPGSFVPPMSPGFHQLLFEFTSLRGTNETSSKILEYSVSGPPISVSTGASANEGTATRSFTIDMLAPLTVPVDVNWATEPATADASDFTSASGTVVFQPGETSKTISVDVVDDQLVEPDEAFTVRLTKGTGFADSAAVRLWQPVGEAQIVDDDTLTVDGSTTVQVTEGDPPPATSTARVGITLNQPAPAGGVLVDWATVDGTATAPADYTAAAGTVAIPEGATSASIEVEVVNDTTNEATESFTVALSNVRAAPVQPQPQFTALAAPRAVAGLLALGTNAVVTVLDNDPAPVDPTTTTTTATPVTTVAPPATTTGGTGSTGASGGTATTTTVAGPIGALPATGQDISRVLLAATVLLLGGFTLTQVRRKRGV